jgi:pimeloyl-ACP methyl ester carboxylesterase
MEKTLKTTHGNTFYADEGNGPPLILLHGFCEDHTLWNDFKQPFLKEYRVITVDFAGFGKSTLSLDYVSIDDMAETVKAVADREDLKKFALLGHSMGGYVTLAFAEKYPLHLSGIGLFHSTGFADDDAKKENRKKVADFARKNGTTTLVKELYGNLFSKQFATINQPLIDGLVQYASGFSPASISNASLAMGNRPDRTAVLKQSAAPVLFIVGRHDQIISFDRSMKIVHLPNASSIEVLEQSAHMGMFEQPKESQKTTNSWLKWILNVFT